MLLTEEQIENNKNTFISLLKNNIKRDYSNVKGLIEHLENHNFFNAPATTQYHNSYKGGLCEYSLKVYKNLKELVKTFCFNKYSEETIAIVGLLFNVCKEEFYEEYIKNEKIYSKSGTKYDSMGNYDWVSTKSYKVKDANYRFLAGGKAFNSYYIISEFLPLAEEEMVAILNQYAGLDKLENTEDINSIMSRYNLVVYLHTASLIASYNND